MMLPNSRPSVSSAPMLAPISPAVVLPTDDNAHPLHTDYDLQPLRVDGLDHYAVLDDQKERFSVR